MSDETDKMQALLDSLEANVPDGSWVCPNFDGRTVKKILRAALAHRAAPAPEPARSSLGVAVNEWHERCTALGADGIDDVIKAAEVAKRRGELRTADGFVAEWKFPKDVEPDAGVVEALLIIHPSGERRAYPRDDLSPHLRTAYEEAGCAIEPLVRLAAPKALAPDAAAEAAKLLAVEYGNASHRWGDHRGDGGGDLFDRTQETLNALFAAIDALATAHPAADAEAPSAYTEREQGRAWLVVVDALDAVRPGWAKTGFSAADSAAMTIAALAASAHPVAGEQAKDATTREGSPKYPHQRIPFDVLNDFHKQHPDGDSWLDFSGLLRVINKLAPLARYLAAPPAKAEDHVAYVNNDGFIVERDLSLAPGMLLYARPSEAREPLSGEQIDDASSVGSGTPDWFTGFEAGARFAEAHHGIPARVDSEGA